MKKKICMVIMFMLISMTFFGTSVNAIESDETFELIVEGPTNGVVNVEMTWELHVVNGIPPYQYGGNWGDDPPGMGSYWMTLPTYENPLIVSKTYTEVGEYLVTFSVSDANDNHDEVQFIVRIGWVEAGGPYIGLEGAVPVFFEGDGFYPGGPYKCTVRWDFGDGHEGVGWDPVHMYEQHGDYVAILTYCVRYGPNPEDEWCGTDTAEVTIYNNDGWHLETNVRHKYLRHNFFWGETNKIFIVECANAEGYPNYSPPFDLVVELWNRDPPFKKFEKYNVTFEPLRPGTSTGQKEFTYSCYERGFFEWRAYARFPGSDYELATPIFSEWHFNVW